MPAVNPQAMESAKAVMVRVAQIDVFVVPGLQTRSFAHYSGARGPGAIASTRWPGVALEPGATLSSRLGVANQQGFAGHFDCCPGLRRALLRSSPL